MLGAKEIAISRSGSGKALTSASRPKPLVDRTQQNKTARFARVVTRATIKEDDKEPEFSLEKALVLGSAAFGAYLDPDQKKGLPRNLLDGCSVRFFDSKFVQEGYAGVLELSGIKVTGASRQDRLSNSDVYIRASQGECFSKTSTKKNTSNPDWGAETLCIWVPKDKLADDVTISVFDSDKGRVQYSADDPLGSTKIQIKVGESQPYDLKLKGEGSGQGMLTLTATYLPFGQSAGDQFLKDVDESITATMSQDAPAEAKEFERSLLSEPGSPKDEDLVRAWDELTNLYEDNVFQDKRTVAFISHRASGTQAWVSRDIKEKKVMVAFRGTEPTHPQDIFTDVDIRQTAVELREKPNRNIFQRILDWPRFSSFKRSGPAVHSGFYRGYKGVQETLLDTIDACTGKDKSWRVYCTGHSLGGALAILLAFELSQRINPDPKYHVSMYNFGGPRVGNIPFVDLYKVMDSWRIHNEHDLVAQIPPAGLMGYRHVDAGVRILENGNGFKFTDANNDDVEIPAGAKWTPRNIVRRLNHRIGDYGELIQKQHEFVRTIAQGRESVAEHLEDRYVEGLVGCLDEEDGTAEAAAAGVEAMKYVTMSRDKDVHMTEAETKVEEPEKLEV